MSLTISCLFYYKVNLKSIGEANLSSIFVGDRASYPRLTHQKSRGLRTPRPPRLKKIHHTTVMNWVKQAAQLLPNSYEPEITPEVGELDELETFAGKKKRVRNFEVPSKCF